MKKIFKSIKKYFKGVQKEIKKIRWTSGKELIKYSTATLSVIIFMSVYFYLIDLIVAALRSKI